MQINIHMPCVCHAVGCHGTMVVSVTVTNGVRSIAFRVETAAGLIPSARDVFGEGTVTDPKGVALTSEYGNLEEGSVYVWSSAGGEPPSPYDPVSRLECH